MDLSIIIVSWNVRALLEKCLRSIERHLTLASLSLRRSGPALSSQERALSVEVFVVDNASNDGTTEMLDRLRVTGYALRVTKNKVNRGFAAANNQGIARATGKYILLLNPDTEFEPHPGTSPPPSPTRRGRDSQGEGALDRMLAFMESHPRCGVLGPKLLNADGSHQPSVRRLPDAWSPTLMSLGITPRKYLALDMDYSKSQQVEQVMGACFLTRRAVIDQIGSLDEHFFIWFEEVDFCKRAADAEWEVWYTPEATVIHHGGQSFAQVLTMRKQWWLSRSLLHYFWKHGQLGAWFLNMLLVPLRLILGACLSYGSIPSRH